MNITQETNNWDNTYSTYTIGDYAINDLSLKKENIIPQPIGYLHSDALMMSISVYKKLSKFKKWCIKKCFGFNYIEL